MKFQRSKEEILEDFKKDNPRTDQGLIIELLLDIREKLNETSERKER